MRNISLLLITLLFLACDKEKYFEGPDQYEDNFESYTAVEDLLIDDDIYWSYTQLTKTANTVQLDTTHFHSGEQSLKFTAEKTDNGASKASLAKQNMAFWEEETIRLTAWYYIEGNQSLEWLFLMDIEEQTAIGAGPGMRLALVNDQLRIEYKFNEKDIIQASGQAVNFPRNEWVEIVWEVKLSQKDEGSVKLWQNGDLIINSTSNVTLPSDILYFQQGTKGMYSSCEIGITANSPEAAVTLWVDDIKFERI